MSAPPDDALSSVFTQQVAARLRGVPTEECQRRCDILAACGPPPRDSRKAFYLHWLRAKKAAWESYLSAAFACGLFEGEDGHDLRARLTSRDDDGFRSALAECMACWFLAAVLRLPVEAKPAGRSGRVLDLLLQLPEGDAHVEVKAPHREPPASGFWFGDDADILVRCLEHANKQFRKDTRNVLFLNPQLRTRVYGFRDQLIHAFFGESKFTVPIDVRTGGAAGPTRTEFYPEGQFLKEWGGDDQRRFTRVGAVVCLEEDMIDFYGVKTRLAVLTSYIPGTWGTAES